LEARNCSINENAAAEGGGLTAVGNSAVLVAEGTELRENTARGTSGGGGLYLLQSGFECYDSLISGNVGWGHGGGLHLHQSSQARFESCELRDNKVENCEGSLLDCGGGGIAVGDTSYVTIGKASSLEGNQAPGCGGAVLAYESSNITVLRTYLWGNEAHGDGGALAIYGGFSALYDVDVRGNKAGARGGALAIVGNHALLRLDGHQTVFFNNSAKAAGGAIFSESTMVLAAAGRTQVEGNVAKEGHGGGFAMSGGLLEVISGHSLSLVRNKASLDGGGVVLLANGRIRFQAEGCESACTPRMVGDGSCDPACMTRGCKWDGGDCNVRFLSADISNVCSAQGCGNNSYTCVDDCFTASCKWGGSNCMDVRRALSACPLFDAIALESIAQDDISSSQTITSLDLPSASRNFNSSEYLAAVLADLRAARGRPDITFAQQPGCGSAPLIVEGNEAGRYGGGLHYASDGCSLFRGKCCLDGIDLGLSAARFQGNYAGMGGGALHFACSGMGKDCEAELNRQIKMFSDVRGASLEGPTYRLSNNSAGKFGPDVATGPAFIKWTSLPIKFAPGIDKLDVEVAIHDWNGNTIHGTSATVGFTVCHFNTSCDQSGTAWTPLKSRQDTMGLMAVQLVAKECKVGSNRLAVRAELVESQLNLLTGMAEVECSCGPGQNRVQREEQSTWWCQSCASGQYVVDPNNPNHSCMPCPEGAICSDGTVTGRLQGSSWEIDIASGVYKLTKCPPGHSIFQTTVSVLQKCVACEPGTYCIGDASPPVTCPEASHSPSGSKALSDCVTVSVVSLVLALPMTSTEFEVPGVRQKFKQSLADTAQVPVENVTIVSYKEVSARRAGLRSLVATSLEVESRTFLGNDASAGLVAERLSDVEKINDNLAKSELPQGEIRSSPVIVGMISRQAVNAILAATVVSVMLVLLFVAYTLFEQFKKASARLVGAVEGEPASQRDLPHELRGRFHAVTVIGSGGSGVVLDVKQNAAGQARDLQVSRAVKIVHASKGRKKLSEESVRRLQREVRPIPRRPRLVHD